MCGIAGLLQLQEGSFPSWNIKQVIDRIRYRGPDEIGFHKGFVGNSRIELGMSRLSIQDVAGGHQPIYNKDKSVCVVFNGEIYNFKELRVLLEKKGYIFATQTDTEVIIYAYEEFGIECLHHFIGQFAFAILDSNKRRLFLARDRIGEKPLFYTTTSHFFLFASEIKALLLHPEVSKEIDYKTIDHLFTFFMPVNPRTMFKHIKNLPPAHGILVENGEVKTFKYWEPPFPPFSITPRKKIDEVEKNDYILDIGQESIQALEPYIQKSKLILWNGPLGKYEAGGGGDQKARAGFLRDRDYQPPRRHGDAGQANHRLSQEPGSRAVRHSRLIALSDFYRPRTQGFRGQRLCGRAGRSRRRHGSGA